MAVTIWLSFIFEALDLSIANPPVGPFEESMILLLTSFCKILAVNEMGESILLEMSLRLTFTFVSDSVAINNVALIPYSQAFENILIDLYVQPK